MKINLATLLIIILPGYMLFRLPEKPTSEQMERFEQLVGEEKINRRNFGEFLYRVDHPKLFRFIEAPDVQTDLSRAYVVGRSCAFSTWGDRYKSKGNKADCPRFCTLPVVQKTFDHYRKADDLGRSKIEELVGLIGDEYNSDVNGHLYYGGRYCEGDNKGGFNTIGRPNLSNVPKLYGGRR